MSRKLTIYLDTNVIFGLFKKILENRFKKKNFNIPWKMKFIQDNIDKIDVYTSYIALSEVVVEIKKWCEDNSIKISKSEIENLIDYFRINHQVKILEYVKITKDILTYTIYNIDIKDGLHLEISKNNKMILVTDDDNLYRSGKFFYFNIMKFSELVKSIN